MPEDDDDFEEVDPDLLEELDDDPVIESIADEATSVGFREDLIDALRQSDGSGGNPLAAIGEAAAELPEGIDAMFDHIMLPTEPAPAIGDTDPAPPPLEDLDEKEFHAFMEGLPETLKVRKS